MDKDKVKAKKFFTDMRDVSQDIVGYHIAGRAGQTTE